jgi:hypothetical protein
VFEANERRDFRGQIARCFSLRRVTEVHETKPSELTNHDASCTQQKWSDKWSDFGLWIVVCPADFRVYTQISRRELSEFTEDA